MVPRLNRRDFLAASTVAGVGLATAGILRAAPARPTLHKAVIGSPTESLLRDIKTVGFDGIESTDRQATPEEAEKARRLAESMGLRSIPSCLAGATRTGARQNWPRPWPRWRLRCGRPAATAPAPSCSCPARSAACPSPSPGSSTFALTKRLGICGRSSRATTRNFRNTSRPTTRPPTPRAQAVQRLIPAAEKAGVVVAVENVWNNLWVKPAVFANFVASFDSPWVRAYFDIGNHVKYAPPQEWILTLGKLIAKCHVKDFKLNPNGHGGDWAALREGSVDWPAVRQALEAVGYRGWVSIEGNGIPLPPACRAGKAIGPDHRRQVTFCVRTTKRRPPRFRRISHRHSTHPIIRKERAMSEKNASPRGEISSKRPRRSPPAPCSADWPCRAAFTLREATSCGLD